MADMTIQEAIAIRNAALEQQDPPMWIYAIKAERGPIKLGISNNPRRRLGDLQQANATTLRGIAAWRALPIEEKWLHEDFADLRMRGEWFRPHPLLTSYLNMRDEVYNWAGNPPILK